MEHIKPPTKIDSRYANSGICFSLRDCSTDKKYSFHTLSKDQAKKFITRLAYIERMVWRDFSNLPRGDGLTTEITGSKSWSMIDDQNTDISKLSGNRYYFHFRAEKVGLFRIFGYQSGHFFPYHTH